MGSISAIKDRISNYIFSRKLRRLSRRKEFHNLESAKLVGVLFNATNDKNYKIVKEFLKSLNTEYKLKTKSLGWIDSDELPDYVIGQQTIFYCNKDLNWLKTPIVPEISKFMNEEFDILFDLSESSHPNIRCIASLSKAACKIGRNGDEKSHLDIIIRQDGEASLEKLIDESILYLKQVKKVK